MGYSFTYDTNNLSNGSHTLYTRATSNNGQQYSTNIISLTVANTNSIPNDEVYLNDLVGELDGSIVDNGSSYTISYIDNNNVSITQSLDKSKTKLVNGLKAINVNDDFSRLSTSDLNTYYAYLDLLDASTTIATATSINSNSSKGLKNNVVSSMSSSSQIIILKAAYGEPKNDNVTNIQNTLISIGCWTKPGQKETGLFRSITKNSVIKFGREKLNQME